eukprot:Gregarina_sp_Poly_1__427@NODE_1103_length_5090_cov_173_869998_g764_i0_p2_GENE_NODE_1103_length_5090_cov_173_869998_g764_i0NODE_1103_length_5090_cov_173_869998_g764_i0_p2_ORF_typecomplete_len434_score50_39_NODE_1103_length_5090_cov_173_869998_g764_i036204921
MCPKFSFKGSELTSARLQSARSVMIDPHRAEPLTFQLFLFANFAAEAYTDILGVLRSLEARDLTRFVLDEGKQQNKSDLIVPNVYVLEATIGARHCRLVNHIRRGKLEESVRAHLGYEDAEFDAGGITLTEDVMRLKECLDDIEYLQDEVPRYINHVRNDGHSVAVGLFGRACEYADFLDYVADMLSREPNPNEKMGDMDSWKNYSREDDQSQMVPQLSVCLYQYLNEETRKNVIQTLLNGNITCPALWLVLLILGCLDQHRLCCNYFQAHVVSILAEDVSPIDFHPSFRRNQAQHPRLTAVLVILTLGHYVVSKAQLRQLFQVVHTYAKRAERYERPREAPTNDIKSSKWEFQRRLLGYEERSFKLLVDISIARLQTKLKSFSSSEDNIELKLRDVEFQEFWLLITNPLLSSGAAIELTHRSIFYGMSVLAM